MDDWYLGFIVVVILLNIRFRNHLTRKKHFAFNRFDSSSNDVGFDRIVQPASQRVA